MNSPSDLLSADYLAASRFHVVNGSPETLLAAQDLGLNTVKNGIDTLTLLDDLGLIPAIRSFMKVFMSDTEVGVSRRTSAITEEPIGEICNAFFSIIQKTLDNMGHHVNASQAEVSIQRLDGIIRIEIKDNGQGVEAEEKMMHNGLGRRCSKRRAEVKISTS